eukprot:gene17866-24962_t
MPSFEKAVNHFNNFILPRRIRDHESEQQYLEKYKKNQIIHRKIFNDETNRGELFPIFSVPKPIDFAPFGKGIGIYFAQLTNLSVTYFIGGMIMIGAIYSFTRNTYGIIGHNSNHLVTISAACKNPIYLNATMGCESNEKICSVQFRDSCDLPYNAIITDLIMSLFLAVSLLISKFFDKNIEQYLDNTIQTGQDYSVIINDPTPDASNPDEWFEFFSKFGKVRYVTILRNNKALCVLLYEKHRLERQIKVLSSLKQETKEKIIIKTINVENKNISALNNNNNDDHNHKIDNNDDNENKMGNDKISLQEMEEQPLILTADNIHNETDMMHDLPQKNMEETTQIDSHEMLKSDGDIPQPTVSSLESHHSKTLLITQKYKWFQSKDKLHTCEKRLKGLNKMI